MAHNMVQTRAGWTEDLQLLQSRVTSEASWMANARPQAWQKFNQQEWPNRRSDAWRFVNLKPITTGQFRLAEPLAAIPDRSSFAPYLLEKHAVSLVFLNGFFRADLSELDTGIEGLSVTNLADSRTQEMAPASLETFERLGEETHPLVALNTAFMEDGAVISIDPNVVIDRPIHLLYLNNDHGHPHVYHPRNLVLAKHHSQATVVETHVSLDSGAYWTNRVTDLCLHEGARLTHCFANFEHESACHLANLRAQVGRGARLDSESLLIGGQLIRNEIEVSLVGEGAECELNGLYFAHENQEHDNRVRIHHKVPHCNSRQYFKGILDHKAHGVFMGIVIVDQDAQKTDAVQTNRNLLLSETARVDTMPQLEIYADDVKCAHGATTGHIDEEALFYLQSRGLDLQTAREILIYAFAHEIVERMGLSDIRLLTENVMLERFAAMRGIGRYGDHSIDE